MKLTKDNKKEWIKESDKKAAEYFGEGYFSSITLSEEMWLEYYGDLEPEEAIQLELDASI